MDIIQQLTVMLIAAAAGEGINEFFFLPWLDTLKGRVDEIVRVQVMRLWSGAVGAGIAWELRLDVFAALGVPMRHPLVGQIVTGLLIGRGSNWIHEFIKRFILENQIKKLQVAR